jgi:DNA-binding response OmpR family regulator
LNRIEEIETSNSLNKTESIRILLVDDDIKFCRLTSDYLGKHGYEVTLVHDGQTGIQRAASSAWDAIILDVMLPGADGYEVLRKIRERSKVPVLMLTALGVDETDRIVGLEIGADDYLPKTFSPRELVARLKAVLRRSNRNVEAGTEFCVGPIAIDLLARNVKVNGATISVTPVEFDLLVVLAQSKGRIKSREQLLNEIRDRNYDVSDRSVDVHVSALRRKLGDDPKNPRYIRTVRAAGYLFMNPGESTGK